jgi:hypothetical protein
MKKITKNLLFTAGSYYIYTGLYKDTQYKFKKEGSAVFYGVKKALPLLADKMVELETSKESDTERAMLSKKCVEIFKQDISADGAAYVRLTANVNLSLEASDITLSKEERIALESLLQAKIGDPRVGSSYAAEYEVARTFLKNGSTVGALIHCSVGTICLFFFIMKDFDTNGDWDK